TGLAIGPAIGGLITAHYSINFLFYASSLFALSSIIILLNLKETHPAKQRFRYSLLKIKWKDILEPMVLPAAIITFLGYISYGATLTLIPDWSEHLGIVNKGTFYVVFTLSSLVVRFVAGRLSDRKGRVFVLRIAFVLIAISVTLLGFASSASILLSAAFLYGISTGLFSPASSAWTADLSSEQHRGRGMATMYIALEAGIGLGAMVAGWAFQDHLERVPYIFYGCALTSVIGLLYLLAKQKTNLVSIDLSFEDVKSI
ncbi:MAG: MFS transporter, partial [Bacteroidota bacterium]|nr:MFS transporter [Bacteroidota bacterium]